jgi:starch synthase (maltosyl-transferring)
VASSKRKAPVKKSTGLAHAPDGTATIAEGRVRAVIDAVLPVVDGGRFPAKRIAGEAVAVEAHCFTDGHDKLRVLLRWKLMGSASADYEIDMQPQPNDVWVAEFIPSLPGRYQYTVVAWVDHFESWRREFERREEKSDILTALQVGAALIDEAAARAVDSDAVILKEWSGQMLDMLNDPAAQIAAQKALALDPARAAIVARYSDRSLAAALTLELIVDRKRAAFSSW